MQHVVLRKYEKCLHTLLSKVEFYKVTCVCVCVYIYKGCVCAYDFFAVDDPSDVFSTPT